MGKSDADVIKEFNEYVNMTKDELKAWLDNPESDKAGLGPGKESGRTIVDILSRNPSKDPSKYTQDDINHARRVAAYCKRHLAQEGHLKKEKSKEEVQHAKSTISLKNWGHDPLKGAKGSSGTKGDSSQTESSKSKKTAASAQKGTKRTASNKKKEATEEPRDEADAEEAGVEEKHSGETADGEPEEEPAPKKQKRGGKKKA